MTVSLSHGTAPLEILVSGMFDMRNFGDLMFPIVAEHELGRRGCRVTALSPTGAPTGLRDALPTRPVWEAANPATACDGVLIGGGYIVHTHRMDTLREYREGGIGAAVAPSVWLGVTLAAALRDVPVAWNAPGAPHPLRPAVKPLAAAAFAAADYLSFRDASSARMANAPEAEIVPDAILGMAQVWPSAGLSNDFAQLCAKLGLDRPDRVLAVHVRRRSLGDEPIARFAEGLAEVCRTLDLVPVMIGLGTAHADDRIARELAMDLRAHGVAAAALDQPDGLREIAALLAHARAYVGSSLHGYVAAVAYGIPGLLVARPAYRKFDGLIGHLDRAEDRMTGWSEAIAALPKALGTPARLVPDAILDRLHQHWDDIAATFAAGPGRKRRARLDFASLAFCTGLESAGPNWAMTPFTTARDRATAMAGDDVRETEPF